MTAAGDGRLSEERVREIAEWGLMYPYRDGEIVALAREVQERRAAERVPVIEFTAEHLGAEFEAMGLDLDRIGRAFPETLPHVQIAALERDLAAARAQIGGMERERDGLKARYEGVYDLLKGFDVYGTGGDAASCAREILMQLSEAKTAATSSADRTVALEATIAQAGKVRDALDRKIIGLCATIEAHAQRGDHEQHRAAQADQRAAKMAGAVRAAEEALKAVYALVMQHEGWCDVFVMADCNCGLDARKAQIDAALREIAGVREAAGG